MFETSRAVFRVLHIAQWISGQVCQIFNWMILLVGSGPKTEEDHLNMNCSALFAIMPTHYLLMEMCDVIQIHFRSYL